MRLLSDIAREILPGERRRHSRSETTQPVELRVGSRVHLATLLDISESGARIKFPTARDVLACGSEVTLKLIDHTEISGSIAWIRKGCVGIEFSMFFLSAEDFLNHDHLGGDYYSRILQLQAINRESN